MSILSNIMKSPVIGGMAQQFNANADFKRKQDAEQEAADYQFGKNIELADYKFKQAEKQAKAERKFETTKYKAQIASREAIAKAELSQKTALIPNLVNINLTKYGPEFGKYFSKAPNTKNVKDKKLASSIRISTFLDTFKDKDGSYENTLNKIFESTKIPEQIKFDIANTYVRDYKQTLQEAKYPGDTGEDKIFVMDVSETKRVKGIPYIMKAIANHFNKDVTRIQRAIRQQQPLALIGNEVELKENKDGKMEVTLPTFNNEDDQGSQIFNKNDELQIAMHIEHRIGPENLPKNTGERRKQVIQVAKAYHERAMLFNKSKNNDVIIKGSDLTRAITGVISATKNLKPGQSVDSDPSIGIKIAEILANSNLSSNPEAISFVIEQALPRHIRNPRYKITTSQIPESEHMKQLVLGNEYKLLDLNTEFGSLQQMKNDATGLVDTLRNVNKGNQTYTGLAADLYSMGAGFNDQARQILTMLPESLAKQFRGFIDQNKGKTFANEEVAKIAIANYYATVLSFRLATIVQMPPGGAATSVRISNEDRAALAVAIQQNIKLSIQNNNTVPLELILRETEQRIAVVKNLLSGDRRKVVAGKLMRNSIFTQQGLFSPVRALLTKIMPNTQTSAFYDRNLGDYTKPLGGDIDAPFKTNSLTNARDPFFNESGEGDGIGEDTVGQTNLTPANQRTITY